MNLNRKPLCKIDKKNRTLTILKTGEVIPMQDLRTSVAFHLKDTHIKNGTPGDPCQCAVSRAIMHATGSDLVVTLASRVYFVVTENKKRVAYYCLHSLASRSVVIANDLGAVSSAPPSMFMLRPPSEASSLRGYRKTQLRHLARKAQGKTSRYNKRQKIVGLRSGNGVRTF